MIIKRIRRKGQKSLLSRVDKYASGVNSEELAQMAFLSFYQLCFSISVHPGLVVLAKYNHMGSLNSVIVFNFSQLPVRVGPPIVSVSVLNYSSLCMLYGSLFAFAMCLYFE